ncbi:MAG: hypothetical protein H6617_00945 [Bdellovibrionaceae bacterium]|nr:hypothetical protein [Pseudobdellovibrionaceae bacterium]
MRLRISISFLVLALSAQAQSLRLSETGLYTNISTKEVKPENRFYDPQYPLWTDGAEKRRWIYLPPAQTIRTQGEGADINHWAFPLGTKIWKEFAYNTDSGLHRVETRLIEKVAEGEWEFGSYVWEEGENDAVLAPSGGLSNHYPVAPGVSHDIPRRADCLTCHRRGGDPVLGFGALQLSTDRDPLSMPSNSVGLDLLMLAREGLIDRQETELNPAPRIHAATAEARVSMGYLHGNCGHCHNPQGSAGWTNLWMRHDVEMTTEQAAPAFLTAVNQPTLFFQIPGMESTFRLKGHEPDKSAVLYRMESTDFNRMPPIGTKLVDERAVQWLREWLEQLDP